MIIVLTGSTRFKNEFFKVAKEYEQQGHAVLMPNTFSKSDVEDAYIENDPQILDNLFKAHLQKIDVADKMIVINPGGYIGQGSKKEIMYALTRGVSVEYICNTEVTKNIESISKWCKILTTSNQISPKKNDWIDAYIYIINRYGERKE